MTWGYKYLLKYLFSLFILVAKNKVNFVLQSATESMTGKEGYMYFDNKTNNHSNTGEV